MENELKRIAKNHYRNIWMVIGMSVFCVSLGVFFSIAFGNMVYLGVVIPVGMVLGMDIGAEMKKKQQWKTGTDF